MTYQLLSPTDGKYTQINRFNTKGKLAGKQSPMIAHHLRAGWNNKSLGRLFSSKVTSILQHHIPVSVGIRGGITASCNVSEMTDAHRRQTSLPRMLPTINLLIVTCLSGRALEEAVVGFVNTRRKQSFTGMSFGSFTGRR